MRRFLITSAMIVFLASCGSDAPEKPNDMGVPEGDMTQADMSDPPDDSNPPGDFDIVLQPRGSGAQPFMDGQEVELVSGFQGGYHIDVNIGVDELPDEANGIARVRVRRVETGERFAGVTAEIFAENWRQLSENIVYTLPPVTTDGFAYPDDAIGERIQLEVTVTMDDGAEDREVVELILVDEFDELG